MTTIIEHRTPTLREDEVPHILVVDDDTRIRTLLSRYLRENGFRASTAGNAADARALLGALSFDLVVLDVMMPGETGVSLTRHIRQTTDIPVLLLTARGEPRDRIEGLEAGADDYLPKPFEPKELVLRMGAVLRRVRPGARASGGVPVGPFTFHPERAELERDGSVVKLTAMECALLRLLAANPGVVISRADLCARTSAGLERSVDVQITRLRRKIEPDPKAPALLRTVRGVGYVLRPVAEPGP
jgi:two-component system phosphate regulon response regulator OmpR